MGLLDKLFKRKNKNVKNAIEEINEELSKDDSEQSTPKEEVQTIEQESLEALFKEEAIHEAIKEDKKEETKEEKIEEEKIKEEKIASKIEEIKEPIQQAQLEEVNKQEEIQTVPVEEVKTKKETKKAKKNIKLSKKTASEEPKELEKSKIEKAKEREESKIEEVIPEIEQVFQQEEKTIQEVAPIRKLETNQEEQETLLSEMNQEEQEALLLETNQEELTEETTELEQEAPKKKSFMKRLFGGLSKTRESIAKGVDTVLSSFKQIDEELYEELEEALIIADFGVDTTMHIIETLKAEVKSKRITDPLALKPALQEIITNFLTHQSVDEVLSETGPTVVLVIGVNGVGKTTSIGKMAHLFKSQNKRVLVAAADTFRAAAIEQLSVWTERAGVEIIKHSEGSDAAAVVFDAISAAKSRKVDVLICDTAGRLQNKTNLMKELEKISRIIAREYSEAKKEILIVIDATTGQNALQQVKLFKEVADINGIILTKLDGTAKGGAIVSIYDSLKVPVKYIGVGEKIDDLQPFDAKAFAKALFDDIES